MAGTVQATTLSCSALSIMAPNFIVLKDGRSLRSGINPTLLATPFDSTRMQYIIHTNIQVELNDAGDYQCIYFDPVMSAVLVTQPVRLDTGEV